MIIAASSVILDGQGYAIRSASPSSSPSVGIWICQNDSAGTPVTGVTVRNLSIEGERYGVYLEGADSSSFPWGKNRSQDPAVVQVTGLNRGITLSEMAISGCGDGIVLNGQTGVRVADTRVSGCSGSGIVVSGGQVQIIRCTITKCGKSGIHLSGGSGSEISSSTISENTESGIRLKDVAGITIYDNLFNNTRNLDAGPESKGIILSTARKLTRNIVGGQVTGGNYWASGGVCLPASSGSGDKDSDGILDRPYEPVAGISDPLPLLKPGDLVPANAGILTLNPSPPPPLPPEPTPAPIQTPGAVISGTHAIIIGDTIPAEMTAGTSYPVTLSLFNDGSDDWIEQYQIGIVAVGDAAKYGPALMTAPVSAPLESGKTLTIPFTLRAPGKPGSYSLKYQAAREGSGIEVLYGRPYTKAVTVK